VVGYVSRFLFAFRFNFIPFSFPVPVVIRKVQVCQFACVKAPETFDRALSDVMASEDVDGVAMVESGMVTSPLWVEASQSDLRPVITLVLVVLLKKLVFSLFSCFFGVDLKELAFL
jgi:hypothetical protein